MTTFHPVHDDFGRVIGWVRHGHLEGTADEVWFASGLDGCELGAHPSHDEAHWIVADDWDAGRPRDPRAKRSRWRPILARELGLKPLYLGR